MTYYYHPSWVVKNPQMSQTIADAAAHVLQRMSEIDFAEIGLSEYNQRYLSEKLKKPEYESCIVSNILGTILSSSPSERSQSTLVDYGAGSGLICLVAKAAGVGTVVYSDIYEPSCNDARRLGDALGFEADHYVNGDISTVVTTLNDLGLEADVLVSHDCIEHIYDMGDFLHQITNLPSRKLHIWLSSAANPLRPKSRRVLTEVAIKAESENRDAKWGHKKGDALTSFLDIRRSIVKDERPDLSDQQIELLAQRSRGLREDDIRQVVRRFADDGIEPHEPDHPTNTCDPWTGNWAERLMNPFDLAKQARQIGLPLNVLAGFWSPDVSNKIKNAARSAANVAISQLGGFGLRLAPYYVLTGTYIAAPPNARIQEPATPVIET